jgi:hypothetical protein
MYVRPLESLWANSDRLPLLNDVTDSICLRLGHGEISVPEEAVVQDRSVDPLRGVENCCRPAGRPSPTEEVRISAQWDERLRTADSTSQSEAKFVWEIYLGVRRFACRLPLPWSMYAFSS